MALTTTNGMSIDDLGGAPNGPGLVQQLGNQVDDFYGKSVANAAALPAAGKFAGQRLWMVDVEEHATWNGTAWTWPTTWAATATDTNITGTSAVTITGMSIAAVAQSTKDVFYITITADLRFTTASAATSISLFRNGASVPGGQIVQGGPANMYGTPSKVWRITGLTPGTHTFTAQGSNFTAATAVVTGNSQIHVQRL
jgi:hypothetical protein